MYANVMGSVTRCSAGACDLVDTGTCGANQKCTYGGLADGGAGRMCAPVGGTQAEGTPCSVNAADVCAPGLACLGNQVNGVCMKSCYKHGDCSATKGLCAIGPISSPNKAEFLTFCARGCDLLTQNCGNAFEGCYPQDNTFSAGACAISQGKVPGASCQYVDECAGGSLCLTPKGGTTSSCVKLCNMDAGTPACGTGTCTPLQGGLGACAP
jgi:hypothetical protein